MYASVFWKMELHFIQLGFENSWSKTSYRRLGLVSLSLTESTRDASAFTCCPTVTQLLLPLFLMEVKSSCSSYKYHLQRGRGWGGVVRWLVKVNVPQRRALPRLHALDFTGASFYKRKHTTCESSGGRGRERQKRVRWCFKENTVRSFLYSRNGTKTAKIQYNQHHDGSKQALFPRHRPCHGCDALNGQLREK